VLLGLAWLSTCLVWAAEKTETDTSRLKLMTFNLRVETSSDGVNAWLYRRDAVAKLIRTAAPAVMGTQEGTYFMLWDLEDRLPEYKWVGVGRDGGRQGEYMAIFYRPEVLDALDSGSFWLSYQPDVPGSRFPGVNHARMATWVHFRVRDTGQEFVVYNTHLDHQSQPGREYGAQFLRQDIAQRRTVGQLPVAVMGDMNCPSSNPAMQLLAADATSGNGLRNVEEWARAHDLRVGATFHGFRGSIAGEPIDHIFVSSEWSIEGYEIMIDLVDERYPSDHYPVVVELALP